MTSANLGMDLPVNFADLDDWGLKLLAAFAIIDNQAGGAINGLTLSAAGSTATFGIAAGTASGMAIASAYTKTTGAWAVGSGNGSLDSGAIANSTWYHVHAIQRPDTGVVDFLTSLSATAPTLPTNYTRSRRIGSMKTDGSAQWLKFTQVGDEFYLGVGIQTNIASSVSATPALFTLAGVPTGVNAMAHICVIYNNSTNIDAVLISSPLEGSNSLDSPTNPRRTIQLAGVGATSAPSATVDVMTNTSAQVYGANSGVAGTIICLLNVYGWRDPRGKY